MDSAFKYIIQSSKGLDTETYYPLIEQTE